MNKEDDIYGLLCKALPAIFNQMDTLTDIQIELNRIADVLEWQKKRAEHEDWSRKQRYI